MEHIDLAFFGYIGIATLLTAVVIVLVTNRGAWMPIIVSIVSHTKDRLTQEGRARRAYRQRVYDSDHMSIQKVSRVLFPINGNGYSQAMERTSEQLGTAPAFLWEQLGTLSDDELLDILARVKDANGNPKFADSRIAKFIGGRVEDRVAQVRDVRGTEPPPPKPIPILRVRDNGIERLIAKYGQE